MPPDDVDEITTATSVATNIVSPISTAHSARPTGIQQCYCKRCRRQIKWHAGTPCGEGVCPDCEGALSELRNDKINEAISATSEDGVEAAAKLLLGT